MNNIYRRKSLRKEIEVLGKLNHPNIIKLYDAIDTSSKVNLIMEYVNGKCISSYINKQK